MSSEDAEDPPQGVIVAVRVRPLWVDGREKGCSCVVRMDGNTTILHSDPEDPEAEPRKYAFDYSYWSADGYVADENGVLMPDSDESPYASQEKVWGDIGSLLMKNAMLGYNCTVFAYGQSGAGKSFSVVGYGPNIGIIPRAVQEIFKVVDGNEDAGVRYEVEIAMIEIYMDKVYDLLTPRKSKRQELKVFINRGEVFIYNPQDRSNRDIIYRACKNAEQAETFRKQGDANRTVRPTGMNPSSSRAHTVFIVRLKKFMQNGDEWVEEWRSKINLVDLAGSERPADTGLSGIGLEEGVAINSSLSALGRVMVQLVEGKRVNYRANRLTEVLAESLNGRAVTCMIAALSPADLNYGDTLSTLRFADNAKKMPVKVEKKLSPTQQLIEDLRKENEALKKRLGFTEDGEDGGDASAENEEAQRLAEEAQMRADALQQELEAMRSDLEEARSALETEEADDAEFQEKIQALQAKAAEANAALQEAEEAEENATADAEKLRERQQAIEILLREQETDFQDKLSASEELAADMRAALADCGLTVREVLEVFERGVGDPAGALTKAPYLVNALASPTDSLLVLLQHKEIPVVSAGVKGSGPSLWLRGNSIAQHHATFRVAESGGGGGIGVALEPQDEAATFVNGEPLHDPRTLLHGDRIVFGTEHAFYFIGGPTAEQPQLAPDEAAVQDWDGRTRRWLEEKLAACQRELEELRSGGASCQANAAFKPTDGAGAGGDENNEAGDGAGNGDGAGAGAGAGGGAAGKAESAQEMAERMLKGYMVDKKGRQHLGELQETMANKMDDACEFLMMNTLNETVHQKLLDFLKARLQKAEVDLAGERQRYLEAQQASSAQQLKAGQVEQNSKLEIQALQAKLDQALRDLEAEKKKCCNCCKCCCSVS